VGVCASQADLVNGVRPLFFPPSLPSPARGEGGAMEISPTRGQGGAMEIYPARATRWSFPRHGEGMLECRATHGKAGRTNILKAAASVNEGIKIYEPSN
jgi:hypothetical protein